MNTYERFMAKVNVHGGNECWNWAGSRSGSGYGQFWDGTRTIPAHWFLLESHPPKGKEACHHCDNKLCVRPSHIFIGTRSDNMQDMIKKGRQNMDAKRRAWSTMRRKMKPQTGSNNPASILSEKDVSVIKLVKKRYGVGRILANHFGVSETVISGIWLGKRWPQVVPDATAPKRCEALLRTLGLWRDGE